MFKSKKFIVLILTVFVCITSLSPISYGKTTIRWWGLLGGPEGESLKALANRYMKINPEITIEMRSGALGFTDVAAFLSAIAAKQTPEVLYWDRFSVPEFAARGAFMPLDDLISSSKVINKEDMIPYTVKEGSFEGHLYVIPHIAASHALAINMTHYKDYGLDPSKPPKDFEEFILYANKLTKYDDEGNIVRAGLEIADVTDPGTLIILMHSLGADWVSIDGKKCTLDDPRAVEALDAIVRLCDTLGGIEKLQDFAGAQQAVAGISYFSTGLTSQFFRAGLWILAQIKNAKPELANEIKVFPQPPMPGGEPTVFLGGWGFVIPSGTPEDKVREVLKFIEFCMSPDNILEHEKASTKVVPYYSALNLTQEELRVNPQEFFAPHLWIEYLDLIEIGFARTPTPFNFLISSEISRAMENAIYHKMSPKEALDQATAVVQKNFDEFYKKRGK